MAQAIPAIIAVGTALYGGYQSNRNRQRAEDQMKKQEAVANQALPFAKENIAQSQQAIGPTLGYYTSLLSNPREALAPEQNRISSFYAGQAQNARNMAPRGGATISSAEKLRGEERGAQTNAVLGGRPMAAAALGTMGSNLAGLGYQGMGLGANILGNVFNQGMMQRQQQGQEGQAIGQGLMNAYQMYMLSNATNTKAAGSVGVPSNTDSTGGMYGGWGINPNASGGLYGQGSYNPSGSSSLLPNSGRSGVSLGWTGAE